MHNGGLVQGGQMQLIRLIRKSRRENMGTVCDDKKHTQGGILQNKAGKAEHQHRH